MVECATFGGEESPVGAIVGGAVGIAAIVLGGACLYMHGIASDEWCTRVFEHTVCAWE